jgi:hypothetical protein
MISEMTHKRKSLSTIESLAGMHCLYFQSGSDVDFPTDFATPKMNRSTADNSCSVFRWLFMALWALIVELLCWRAVMTLLHAFLPRGQRRVVGFFNFIG